MSSRSEPLELWRAWYYDGQRLRSPQQGTEWLPGMPFTATCPRSGHLGRAHHGGRADTFRCEWVLVAGGEHNLVSAAEQTRLYNAFSGMQRPHIAAPTRQPPDGYGYKLVPEDAEADPLEHEAPVSGCSCGIYALDSPWGFPGGNVYGKVKLWGKIIPGGQGARGQYAYPSELYVEEGLLDDEGLRAYGVPLRKLDETPGWQPRTSSPPTLFRSIQPLSPREIKVLRTLYRGRFPGLAPARPTVRERLLRFVREFRASAERPPIFDALDTTKPFGLGRTWECDARELFSLFWLPKPRATFAVLPLLGLLTFGLIAAIH